MYETICSLPCSEECLDNCNQTSGSCVMAARKATTTRIVTARVETLEKNATQTVEHVAENCDKSSFGSRCYETCQEENCKGEICETTRGSCYRGIAGYFGNKCNKSK